MKSDRFTELLNRYLENNSTGQEREELMQLIREGYHDEVVKDKIDVMLLNDPVLAEMDSRKAGKMLAAIMSNEEAKVIPIQGASARWGWVAAAVLLITVSGGWWLSRTESLPGRQLASKQVQEVLPVVFSGKQFIHLPDGSTVLLNDGTSLTYDSSFGNEVREVTLNGEGYFDVQHDPSKPFKVLTGKITTTVLGTAFNVSAYAGRGEIKVTVTRGKVRVDGGQRTFGVISPDQQIIVNVATNDFIQRDVTSGAEPWQSQYLILDNVSLEEAIKTIGKKYKVKITLSNDGLKTCRISATFLNGEDLEQVLAVVSGVVQATYTMLPDGNVIINGKGCKG